MMARKGYANTLAGIHFIDVSMQMLATRDGSRAIQGDMGCDFRRSSVTTAVFLFLAAACLAQSPPPGATQPATASPLPAGAANGAATPAEPQEDKRIFGVLPNNRTTEASIPFARISAKQKLTIAYKDSFDWPVYPTAGLFAALYQLENQNPSFGQGMAGYAKRFGSAYGDQMIGNMMTEGFIPALTHEDPRFFRLGQGTKKHRMKVALMQIVVTRTDSGGRTFNLAEWGGNAAAAAISNAYYPDTRTAKDNTQKWLMAVGTDAFSNVLKEFWPDVKHWMQSKRHSSTPASAAGLTPAK